jgi:hypothetical protein
MIKHDEETENLSISPIKNGKTEFFFLTLSAEGSKRRNNAAGKKTH